MIRELLDAPPSSQASKEIDHRSRRIAYWNLRTSQPDRYPLRGDSYRRRLGEVYASMIGPGQRVLELGCGQGDLLAMLKPSVGVGVDFSAETLEVAKQKYPNLRFIEADVHDLELDEEFDVIILSDLVNELWDIQKVFEKIGEIANPQTRIVLTCFSKLWQVPLAVAQRLGLITPRFEQNWVTVPDLCNLLNLADLEMLYHSYEVLAPIDVPLLSRFCNRYLVKLWPFSGAALTNFLVARPKPKPMTEEPLVSVIVPARNEEGNIKEIFEQVPEMGRGTELVFVEGHSKDSTYQTICEVAKNHPERRCKILRQTGEGKGDAVRLGFGEASGEVLMILDADLTVPPQYLPRFYRAIVSGAGEMINGVRLVYPMEDRAMRPANFLGNKFFSLAFSWLLSQPIKDTLCGTKVLTKENYELIARNRNHFGDFDPFGDFDLLFGAARLRLKIVEIPIRYRERTYGTTNIQRWKHGLILLRMVLFAARRIKFI